MLTILQAAHITKRYKNGRGIYDMSLDLRQGETFGLIGPNGAGKTTFLKILSGLLTPDVGETVIGGHSLRTDYEMAMKSMGCLIEAPSLYESFTAYRNLQFHARFYPSLGAERIDSVLNRVGLTHVKHDKVKNFSQGMKQRLGIAIALLSNPEIIVLDEPTNGLDVEGIIQFKELVKSLNEEKKRTILISSHQMFELESLCDRVGVIYDGKLICVEDTARIAPTNRTLEQWYVDQIRSQRGGTNDE